MLHRIFSSTTPKKPNDEIKLVLELMITKHLAQLYLQNGFARLAINVMRELDVNPKEAKKIIYNNFVISEFDDDLKNAYSSLISYGRTLNNNDLYIAMDLAKKAGPEFCFPNRINFPSDKQEFKNMLISFLLKSTIEIGATNLLKTILDKQPDLINFKFDGKQSLQDFAASIKQWEIRDILNKYVSEVEVPAITKIVCK